MIRPLTAERLGIKCYEMPLPICCGPYTPMITRYADPYLQKGKKRGVSFTDSVIISSYQHGMVIVYSELTSTSRKACLGLGWSFPEVSDVGRDRGGVVTKVVSEL
ncbi:Uncharacterized protein TCM_017567 [Theobroma cacao]|uniref:Uncharacterized protein n=1 Tax=Theobroma cacao TaxID=3641 RepID=A0A061EFD4_THECC|nr:Uncharacterized protein TCM_017567 [Theobroma cacao]